MFSGWFTRVAIVLAILGVAGFDAISVGIAQLSATDDAGKAALAASSAWRASRGNVQTAYAAAVGSTQGQQETVDTKTFTIAADGTVTLHLHRVATTLVLWRISPLKHWADVEATGTGRDTS